MRAFLLSLLVGYFAVGCRAPGARPLDRVSVEAVHEVPVSVGVRHALTDDGVKLRGLCQRPIDSEKYWILLDDALAGTLPEAVALHELGHAFLGMDYPHSDDPACAMHSPTPSLEPCPAEATRAGARPRGSVFVVTITCPTTFADATRRAMATWNRVAGRTVFVEATTR